MAKTNQNILATTLTMLLNSLSLISIFFKCFVFFKCCFMSEYEETDTQFDETVNSTRRQTTVREDRQQCKETDKSTRRQTTIDIKQYSTVVPNTYRFKGYIFAKEKRVRNLF